MNSSLPCWRAPRLWRNAQLLARGIVACLARLQVTGDVPDPLRRGPLILAANHISPFDPIVLAAACQVRGINPRIMATGGLFRAPVLGGVMRHCGHIRVDRRTAGVAQAFTDATSALISGSVVLVYPEGRMGLDPEMWPERGKSGTARLAFATSAVVVPVAQWGAHEVLPYSAPRGMLRAIVAAIRHRPLVRVHFGTPIDFADLTPGVTGAARAATDRIIEAITTELVPLRPDEPHTPRHVDPSRPTETTRAYRRPRLAAGPDRLPDSP